VVGAVSSTVLASGADGFCATANAMRSKTFEWWWSFHAHSPITEDIATERGPTFGYRQIRSDCGIAGVPLVVSEAGPAGRSWVASDGPWLAFFDRELALDTDVKGAALAAGFASIEADLLEALTSGPAADAGTPDGGSDGGGGGAGSVAPPPIAGAADEGPLVPAKARGCSYGSPGATALALVPLLFALRRRHGAGRGVKCHGAKR
jgi:Synergist-CTERM protein sorting domain-containing protein